MEENLIAQVYATTRKKMERDLTGRFFQNRRIKGQEVIRPASGPQVTSKRGGVDASTRGLG